MKTIKEVFVFLAINMVMISILSGQESKALKVGDKAPLFTAYDDENQPWSINKYIGNKNIVIFFYPAAMTGGCTKQACSYRDSYAELEKADALVVGISGDEVENLKLFKKTNDLNFTLLSDNTGEIARKFNVPVGDGNSIIREINGKEFTLTRGVTARRWTYVINKEGDIIYVNQEVDAGRDSQEVMKVLRALK